MTSDIQFLIDWNNDGDFSDANENVTSYVMNAAWSLGFSEPYQHVASETRLTMRLRNIDKRFSPEGTASPMAGSILPQRRVRIQDVSSGTVEMYNGLIESINPVVGEHSEKSTQIVCIGLKQFLERQEYFSPFWEGVTSDEVIEDILLNTTIPRTLGKNLIIDLDGQNLIDTHWVGSLSIILDGEAGKTTYDYVGDTWEDGIPAIRAINDLVQTDRGWFFQSREGSAVYWNRHHMIMNDTILGTVDNTWAEMDYRFSMSDIKNDIRVWNYPRSISPGSTEILWEMDEVTRVEAGGTATFRARYGEQDSDSKVSGRNVTIPNEADVSLVTDPTGRSYSLRVLSDDARSMEIEFVNNNEKKFDIVTMIIRGQKVTTYNRVEITAVDSQSISDYGRHVMTINHQLLDNEIYARALADYELDARKTARGVVRGLKILPRNDDLIDMGINRTIGDWLNVVDDQTEHDGNYIIMGESHRWRDGGYHEVDYVLERSSVLDYLIIDVAGKNGIDDNRYLAL